MRNKQFFIRKTRLLFGLILLSLIACKKKSEIEPTASFSTPPTVSIEWQKAFGEDNDSLSDSIIKTSDGGFIIMGTTYDYTSYGNTFVLIKIDKSGNQLWRKTFEDTGGNPSPPIIETLDGGFVIELTTYDYVSGINNVLVVKIDSLGNDVWRKTFGDIMDNYFNSIIETSDKGLVFVGITYDYVSGIYQFLLMKTDTLGNTMWERKLGEVTYDSYSYIIETSDKGLGIFGTIYDYSSYGNDFLVIKTDNMGNEIWQWRTDIDDYYPASITSSNSGFILEGKNNNYYSNNKFLVIKIDRLGNEVWRNNFDGSDYTTKAIEITSDGGLAIIGDTYDFVSGDTNFLVAKIDSSGNEVWQKNFGKTKEGSDIANTIIETSDKGYVITGSTYDSEAQSTYFSIMKINSSGDEVWQKTFEGISGYQTISVVETSDGGLILYGDIYNSGSGTNDFWLIKIKVE